MIGEEIHPDAPPLVRHLVGPDHLVVALRAGELEGLPGQVDQSRKGFAVTEGDLGGVEVIRLGGAEDLLEEGDALFHILADLLFHIPAGADALAGQLLGDLLMPGFRHIDGRGGNAVVGDAVFLEESHVEGKIAQRPG